MPSVTRQLPFGYPPTAIGYPPTAIGYPPTAIGYSPTAIGYPPTAISYPPNAIGYPPTAIGYPPTAIGYPPTAIGYPPTAIGQAPTAVSHPLTAIDYPPTAFCHLPTAVGYPTTARLSVTDAEFCSCLLFKSTSSSRVPQLHSSCTVHTMDLFPKSQRGGDIPQLSKHMMPEQEILSSSPGSGLREDISGARVPSVTPRAGRG